METTLSVRESIRYGWHTFKQRPWFLIGVTLLIGVINVVIPGSKESYGLPVIVIIEVIAFLVGLLVQLGGTSFALRAHDDVAATKLKDLWRPQLYLRYAGTTILTLIVVLIALGIPVGITYGLYTYVGNIAFLALILLIPGIILAIALSFTTYLVVDQGTGPVAALKESMRITKGNRGKLLLLGIAVTLLNLLGLICLFVGLLVTLPISALAMVHAYRVLSGTMVAAPEAVPTPVTPEVITAEPLTTA